MGSDRRVVRGIKDSRSVKPKTYADPNRVQSSVNQTLQQAASDAGVDYSQKVNERFPRSIKAQPQPQSQRSIQATQPGSGTKRVVIKGQQPRYGFQIDKTQQTDYRTKRAKDIAKLLNEHTARTANDARQSRLDTIGAANMALAQSPAAAAAIMQRGKKKAIDIQRGARSQSLNIGRDAAQMQKRVTGLGDEDQLRDPESPISQQYRSYLKQRMGLDLPKGVSAWSIKQMFPFVQLQTKDQTSRRGQDIGAQQKQLDRQSKQRMQQHQLRAKTIWQGNRNASRERVAQLMAQAGIDKQVIGKVIAGQYSWQNTQARSGGSGGAGLAIGGRMDGQGNFWKNPTKPGMVWQWSQKMGPRPTTGTVKQVEHLQARTSRTMAAADQLNRLVQQAQDGIFDSGSLDRLNRVISSFESLLQVQPKFHENGVMNFADLQRARRQVGDAQSFLQWITGTTMARSDQFKQSVANTYNQVMGDFGFVQTQQKDLKTWKSPGQLGAGAGGKGGSGGGGSGGSARQFNASGAANKALQRHGLPQIVPNEVAQPPTQSTTPQPQTPDIPTPQQQAQKRRKAAQVLKKAMQR